MSDDIRENVTEETKDAALEMENKTSFSEGALDKMIEELKDESADVVPENFDFGEKKVDKKKRSKFVIKLISALICLGVFLANGIAMRAFGGYKKYAELVPDYIQIIIIIASLYAVGVIANIIGGAKQEEYHVKEEE